MVVLYVVGGLNLLQQPIVKGQQNLVFVFIIRQVCAALITRKRMMKMTAATIEGTYFQR